MTIATNIIYTVRNLVNGKIYVGQSTQGLSHRKSEHLWRHRYGARDHKIYRAMKKYGSENFEFSVFCHALQEEFLNELEQSAIAEFNSYRRGYNMNEGGNGVSKETRMKLSASLCGRKITWGAKIVATRRANGGYVVSEFSRSQTVKKHARAFIVELPNGNCEHVVNLHAFCRAHSIDSGSMHATINGRQHHHKGFKIIARLRRHGDIDHQLPMKAAGLVTAV